MALNVGKNVGKFKLVAKKWLWWLVESKKSIALIQVILPIPWDEAPQPILEDFQNFFLPLFSAHINNQTISRQISQFLTKIEFEQTLCPIKVTKQAQFGLLFTLRITAVS